MQDFVQVYYLPLKRESQYNTRWNGRKYIFKKSGIYKVPGEFADSLLVNDAERFGETKEALYEARGISLAPKKAGKRKKASSKP